jgi:hypothetical protein
MCAYAQLAWLSHEKRQSLARDRFLVLAGVAACEAGWPDAAGECHQLLVHFAPQHQFVQFDSFPAALQTEDCRKLARSIARHCPYERAEHLLQELGRSARGDAPELSRGNWVCALLTRSEWHAP